MVVNHVMTACVLLEYDDKNTDSSQFAIYHPAGSAADVYKIKSKSVGKVFEFIPITGSNYITIKLTDENPKSTGQDIMFVDPQEFSNAHSNFQYNHMIHNGQGLFT
eukprot:14669_1